MVLGVLDGLFSCVWIWVSDGWTVTFYLYIGFLGFISLFSGWGVGWFSVDRLANTCVFILTI